MTIAIEAVRSVTGSYSRTEQFFANILCANLTEKSCDFFSIAIQKQFRLNC